MHFSLCSTAYTKIGEYYADRQKWEKAYRYFLKGKNLPALVQRYVAQL
jgi:hypothetical protein